MPIKHQVENYARKLAEGRPTPTAPREMVVARQPFSDDGIVPNHPR